jgi:hypothetical protein
MRLEKKHDEELAGRKGLAGRTVIQLIWLAISFAIAFYLVNALFEQGTLSYNMVYGVGIPRSIPEWVITLAFMIVVVMAMQFILFIGYAVASPEGRRRTGDPTMHSSSDDPYDYGQE